MEPSDRPAGRHRAPDPYEPPPRPAGGAHRAPAPPEPEPEPEPEPAPAAGPSAAEERATDLARFLAAARERSNAATAAPVRDRPAPARRRWLRPVGVAAVVSVAVVGLGAAVHGLREGAGSAPTPALAASGAAPSAGSAPATSAPAPAPGTPSTGSTPTATTHLPFSRTSSAPAPSGPPASRPPVKVREVPVVPVPATANGAAWQRVVTDLFTARSAAFATGRPGLLTAADAPGSAVLRADRQLYAAAVRAGGFTRASGLGFDLGRVRLLAAGPTTARLAVAGRERTYVLRGPAGDRVVPAGPRRSLTLQLTRSSATARWLLSAGSIRTGG